MNTGMHVPFGITVSFGYMPDSGIAGTLCKHFCLSSPWDQLFPMSFSSFSVFKSPPSPPPILPRPPTLIWGLDNRTATLSGPPPPAPPHPSSASQSPLIFSCCPTRLQTFQCMHGSPNKDQPLGTASGLFCASRLLILCPLISGCQLP